MNETSVLCAPEHMESTEAGTVHESASSSTTPAYQHLSWEPAISVDGSGKKVMKQTGGVRLTRAPFTNWQRGGINE